MVECRSLGTSGDMLRRFDVSYFGISVDSPATNARFARSLELDYPILSDPSKDAARAYGVLSASGFASRWTFYIGADGRILDIDRHVTPGSHGRDLASKLSELKVPKAP
jgi:peroxiredoxin Q/BCP